MQDGKYKGFSILSYMTGAKDVFSKQIERHIENSLLIQEFEDPSSDYVEDPCEIEVQDVYELDLNRMFIRFRSTQDINVSFFIFKSDYHGLPEDVTDSISIEEWDWNKHYSWATKVITVDAIFLLILGVTDGKVLDLEVEDVNLVERCRQCHGLIRGDTLENCPHCDKPLGAINY